MKRTFLALGAVAIAIGVAVLAYRGPGRAFVRGHVGDVAATMLVFALLSLAWRGRLVHRAVATMVIATAIEVGQTFWQASSTAGHLVWGSTFDPIDFVAYIAGIGIAVMWERTAVRRRTQRRGDGACVRW